ncbi:MAG: cysteine synthase family protein [Candidatus Zixiibacteriota bacterium]
MTNYANSLLDLIGNTPMFKLPGSITGSKATILAKMECANPAGSVKDRMAAYVICTEEKRGNIKIGDTIIDATSGNTGVAAAMVAAIKGYRSIFAVPTSTSDEKINLIKSFGAKVISTPCEVPSDDPASHYCVAKRLAQEHGYYFLNQFDNQLNPEAHYYSTGPEIWRQTAGTVTHVFGGLGTGGTMSGTGRFLKEQNRSIKVYGVEPRGSLFSNIHGNRPLAGALPHKVEGIGTDRMVTSFHPKWVDQVIQIDDSVAFAETRLLSRALGLSVGGSTGAIFAAVRKFAADFEKDDVVVFFVCDGGIRYMTKVFSDEWMKQNHFNIDEEQTANAENHQVAP